MKFFGQAQLVSSSSSQISVTYFLMRAQKMIISISPVYLFFSTNREKFIY